MQKKNVWENDQSNSSLSTITLFIQIKRTIKTKCNNKPKKKESKGITLYPLKLEL